MKKFFSLFVTAAVALFGLTCCGGGGDSEAGMMTIKDFSNGAKKFVVYNRLTLEIIPEGLSNNTHIDIDSATEVTARCMIVAGDSHDTVANITYTRSSDTLYRMSYSFMNLRDLDEREVITAFGFSPITSESGSDWVVPDSIPTLGVVDIFSELDFETHMIRTSGRYRADANDDDNSLILEDREITGQMRSFVVVPK